jgi:dTMP kinase
VGLGYTRGVIVADRPAGHFISIEGPDGSGKTHQARLLADALRERGHDVVLTREPGGTPLGDRLYELLMASGGEPIDPVADALLFNASRAQHVAKVIRPALAAGRVVISARFADSTIAYQGYGGGVDLGLLRQIIAVATGGLVPDRTLLLDLDAATGLARKTPDSHTRFETSFDLPFHLRVRAGFLEMAAAEPLRWVIVDADRSSDAVFASILDGALEIVEPSTPAPIGSGQSEPTAGVGRIDR